MSKEIRPSIRVLVVDDEPAVLDAYRQILSGPDEHPDSTAVRRLGAKLFATEASTRPSWKAAPTTSFDTTYRNSAETAVSAVRDALTENRPFAVVFLDMRLPPGPDGVWAAARIRELDPAIEIAVVTAYSDVDPGEIGGIVPPEDKLSYLQKPFHPHEVRQMAIALASKWRAERHVARLAYFDSLTGLPNREQARARLLAALGAAQQHGRTLALLYIDLDNFKRVNDTLGHAVGDEVLTTAAARLRKCLRYSDGWTHGSLVNEHPGDIGRLGGDEFIVVLPSIRSSDDARIVADRLVSALQEPMELAHHSVVITPSIGIAISPTDGNDAETLLRHADLAMYFAKRRAPGSFAYFDPSMTAGALKRYTIEGKLRGALERGELTLHYQPQFDISSGNVGGVEALLRWTNDELGAVPPTDFIPVAEESGLIIPIGEWVLRAACAQAKTWHDEDLPVKRMAVNISGQQFALKGFPAVVARVLAETGLPPAMLELEITESTVTKDEAWAEQVLAEFRQVGVSIAIDDFGTGYSNFDRLHHLAVDRLKMDRSFVRHLGDKVNDRAIAAAIISMAKSLHLDVVAEGVESFAQLRVLQENHCEHAQGFLLSRPMPASETRQLLERAAEHCDGGRTQKMKRLMG